MQIINSFYLDTSAINHLYDDPQHTLLTSILDKKKNVFISIFTFAEIASTKNKTRRNGLLKLTSSLLGGYIPAAMPGDLLKRSFLGIYKHEKDMNHSMDSKWNGIILALVNPELIDEETFDEIVQWKTQQEHWYHKMHDEGRPKLQSLLSTLHSDERNAISMSFPSFIRYYLSKPEFIQDIVIDIALKHGYELTVDRNIAQAILYNSEHWRFFLLGMAYGLYVRSIRNSHYSRDRNPGSIDTQQSIYLTTCDIFVTADHQQYNMLRYVNIFGNKQRHIWKYNRFRNWLMCYH